MQKKMLSKEKAEKGKDTVDWAWLERWIAEEGRIRTDSSWLAIHYHVVFTRSLKRIPVGSFKAIVLQQARYYSFDLRFFKSEIPRNIGRLTFGSCISREVKMQNFHFITILPRYINQKNIFQTKFTSWVRYQVSFSSTNWEWSCDAWLIHKNVSLWPPGCR